MDWSRGDSGGGRAGPVAAAALALATFALFLPAGRHDFLVFDDDVHVTENPWVRQGLTIAGVRWAFTSLGYGANWHPLAWLSHMLDVELFGLSPRGHHLVSVGLHAGASALLLLALARLTGSLRRSALAAALFALHPLRLESVAWIAERKDVLAACFWSASLLLYAGYVRAPGAARYLAVLSSFAAALLSKPVAVTLPLLLLLLDWWPLGRLRLGRPPSAAPAAGVTPARALAEKAPLLALSALAGAATYAAQRAGGALTVLDHFPLGVRAANALWSGLAYLRKALLPVDLAIFYPHPGHGLSPWQTAAAALALAGLSAAAVALRRRRPYLAVGWAWYLVALAPMLGLVQVGAQGMADRYTYLPLTGIFLALAFALPGAGARARVASAAAAAAAVGACALLTASQIGAWRDSRTIFARALEVTENNWMAHNVVGAALLREGDAAGAERHFAQAAAIRPGSWTAQYNLGNSLLAQGNLPAAAAAYRRALARDPLSAPTLNNLGVTYLKSGRLDEARRCFREALRLRPGFADAQRNLGLAGAPAQP